MNRLIKCLHLLAMVCISQKTVHAQKTVNLSLLPKQTSIRSSTFSNVEIIDNRLDTSNLGFIQKGALNRLVPVTTPQPFMDELGNSIIKLVNDASKQEGTLLINIRQFALSEFLGKGGENGVFRFSAVFYLKHDSLYRKVLTVNTNVVVKAGFGDVTQKLLDTVPEVLGNFVQQVASFEPAHADSMSRFTAVNFESLDYMEKETIPVYNSDMPQKGLYATFDEFRNNRPSRQVIIVHKYTAEQPKVYEIKADGKKGKQIKPDQFYVVYDGEKMFISGTYGLHTLSKRDDDFYFRSLGREGGDGSPMVAGQTVIIGRSGKLPFEWSAVVFKIDHITGKFIPVRMAGE
jgi:hypothetical protein